MPPTFATQLSTQQGSGWNRRPVRTPAPAPLGAPARAPRGVGQTAPASGGTTSDTRALATWASPRTGGEQARPARQPGTVRGEAALTALKACERGISVEEPGRERREAELHGFKASLIGMESQEFSRLIRRLQNESASDGLSRQKLEIAQRSEVVQSVVSGDALGHIRELQGTIADLKQRQEQARRTKDGFVLRARALVASSARHKLEEQRQLIASYAELEQAYTKELGLLRGSAKELDILRALLKGVSGPDASGLEHLAGHYLDELPEFLRGEIAAADGRYDVSRLRKMLARLEREPLARETMAAVRARGGETLYKSRDTFQEALARKMSLLHSLEPNALKRLFSRWGWASKAPERESVRRGLTAEIAQVQADLERASQRIEIYESDDYGSRVEAAQQHHATTAAVNDRLTHIQQASNALR